MFMIYVYYRVSTNQQDYQNQRLGILDFCKRRNLKIDKEYIEKAIEHFNEMVNNILVSKFEFKDSRSSSLIWLGGGSGYISMTITYQMLGDRSVDFVSKMFDERLFCNKKEKPKHINDRRYGVSPHTLKITYYKGRKYQFGLCDIKLIETI